MTTARPDSRLGTDLGPYRIERVLGRGGMGVVYLAEQRELGRKVALKLLPDELAQDADFRARFDRESHLAASIDHPNIIPLYEAGEIDGTAFLAMRFVDGVDLASRLHDGPLEPTEAVGILAQVAGALDAAHERGLVHRDVKPGNVLLDRTAQGEHAYLTDFGLTKQTGTESGLTRMGSFMGTPAYMAPEQIEGQEVDGRADQYSLACMAFELLTGSVPFTRDQEFAVAMAHVRDRPPAPTSLRAELPAAVDVVFAQAMAKDREARYATCTAFVEDLRSALGGGAVVARPIPAEQRRRIPLLVAAVLALGLVAVAGLALASGLFGGSAASPSSPPGLATLMAITPENGAGLKEVSVHDLAGQTPGALSIVDDVAYAGQGSSLVAYRIDCLEHAPCPALWTATVDGRIHEPPRIHDGTLYAGADQPGDADPAGSLYAFPASCAEVGGTCAPTWHGAGGDLTHGAPLFVEGGGVRAVAAISDSGLRIYNDRCVPAGDVCTPTGIDLRPRRDLSAAGVGTFIYAGTQAQSDGQGHVLAYVANCNASNCPIDWEWSGSGDVTAVEVAGDDLLVGVSGVSSGGLDVYALSEESCRPGGCDEKWTAEVDGDVLDIAISARSVIVLSTGGVTAYSRFCATTCDPAASLWTYSSPTPLNGRLTSVGGMLYAGSLDGTLVALSEQCDRDCAPIWTGTVGGAVSEVFIAADERHLLAAGADGLHVFGVVEGDAGSAPATPAVVPGPKDSPTPDPSVFPNTAESALLAKIPAALAATCVRGAGKDDLTTAGWNGRIVTSRSGNAPNLVNNYEPVQAKLPPKASLVCTPSDGPDKVFFQEPREDLNYSDSGEEAATAVTHVGNRYTIPSGDCSSGASAMTTWSVGGSTIPSGSVTCIPKAGWDGSAWIYWSFSKGNLLGFATRMDADYDALYRWWQNLTLFIE